MFAAMTLDLTVSHTSSDLEVKARAAERKRPF
jgi:hypothetical protein